MDVLCDVPVCSVVELLVVLDVFTPNEPPILPAMLLKAVVVGATPIVAEPIPPKSGPSPGTNADATAPPNPRALAANPATGEQRETEVPEPIVSPALMPALMPFVVCFPLVSADD